MSRTEIKAIEFLADIRFHRSLWLLLPPDSNSNPETDTRTGTGTGNTGNTSTGGSSSTTKPLRLRVTYADIGDQDGSVILYCGGLFSSRYTLAQADKLAKRHRVRLICPDKPGVGGSDGVELEGKVRVWLDIAQALIDHLRISRIAALVGHSSGAVYILNTLLHQRHLLQRNRPYVALVAPWIHPSHSNSLVPATIASELLLPDWVIRQWYAASYLVTRTGNVKPTLGPSTARAGVTTLSNTTTRTSSSSDSSMESSDNDDGRLSLTRAIDEKILEYALLENVQGISQEALFCLKRGGGGRGDHDHSDDLWGPWGDYDRYVPLLRDREATVQQQRQQPHRDGQDDKKEDSNSRKLRVDVFFAESDGSSGKSGSRWFDDCWKRNIGIGGGDSFCYASSTAPGTTHETIMRPEFGVLGTIFERVAR